MGGYGSTRWGYYSRKTTVEESIKLDALQVLPPTSVLSNRAPVGDVITWSTGGRLWGAVSYHVEYAAAPTFCLAYGIATGERVTDRVPLVATYPFNQVARWWFACPACGRRCRCLYKPPASRRFACLKCHDLSYNERQDSHTARVVERTVPGIARLVQAQKVAERLDRCKYQSKRFQKLLKQYDDLLVGAA